MLHFIGLGLSGCDDITVKGLRLVKSSKYVYLEAYTSILTVGKEALVSFKTLIINLLSLIMYIWYIGNITYS